MKIINQASLNWIKSSRCDSSACVEAAQLPDGGVAIRDSKQEDHGPVLQYNPKEWKAFLEGVKSGDFDHLLK